MKIIVRHEYDRLPRKLKRSIKNMIYKDLSTVKRINLYSVVVAYPEGEKYILDKGHKFLKVTSKDLKKTTPKRQAINTQSFEYLCMTYKQNNKCHL